MSKTIMDNSVTSEPNEFMRLDEFAEMLGVTPGYVGVMKNRGRIPRELYLKASGRSYYRRSGVIKWLNSPAIKST